MKLTITNMSEHVIEEVEQLENRKGKDNLEFWNTHQSIIIILAGAQKQRNQFLFCWTVGQLVCSSHRVFVNLLKKPFSPGLAWGGGGGGEGGMVTAGMGIHDWSTTCWRR